MADNYLKIISAIPKLAFGLLVVIGVAIVFEIINLFKVQKKAEKEGETEAKSEKPFRFFLIKKNGEKVSSTSLSSLLSTLIIILVILIVLIGLVAISKSNLINQIKIPKIPVFSPPSFLELPKPSITNPSTRSPSLSSFPSIKPTESVRKEPIIKIYQLKAGKLISVEEADLKLLTKGEKIRIVVENSNQFKKAVFLVNEVPIATSSFSKRTGSGDFFDEYIIPEGINDFKIVVKLF